ncbi:MAG: hypothetical protein HY687_00680 [Chloroflexi bacterium]|nr:hypothetical protein [Chloroflexota bacterium]
MLRIDKVTYENLPAPECECVGRFITEELAPEFERAGSTHEAIYLFFSRGQALGLLDENPEGAELPWEHQQHIKVWLNSLPYNLDNPIDLFVSW